MNAVREINRINQRELELGVADKGSWHDQYKDSAYVFIGGLPYDLTEGDVITVFSQFGEVMDINMPRDKETGKVRGFAFLMFEDQRSTVLAVDNMNGCQILGRTIRVDHCRKYKQAGTKNEEGDYIEPEEPTYNAAPPILEGSDESESSESEAADSIDEEDPMATFLRAEKKKAKAKAKGITNGKDKKRKHEGETKEERRARKEAKRAKKAAKEAKKSENLLQAGGLREKERDREYSKGKGREERNRGRHERDARRIDDPVRETDRRDYEPGRGRANRDDWREGRWELERDEKERDRKRHRFGSREGDDRERSGRTGDEGHRHEDGTRRDTHDIRHRDDSNDARRHNGDGARYRDR